MKKLSLLFITLVFTFAFSMQVDAASNIVVKINGEVQSYQQPPVIDNGSTLVPMRGIFESLGATIIWDGNTKTVIGQKEDTTIILVVGNDFALVNGKSVKLEQKAKIINKSTMVPLRFVSEALGAKVTWDGNTKTVIITKSKEKKNLTPQELFELNNKKVVLIKTDAGLLGSGVIIKDGLVLTNYHVIEGMTAGTITTSEGKKYQIEGIVVFNKNTDLAVIKSTEKFNIEPIEINSPKTAKSGEKIVTIGNPEGFQNTISEGIISGFREYFGIQFVQITAPITHGSSGGALFNQKGEVIGITSKASREGNLNFAVSIDHISHWLEGTLAQEYENIKASFNLEDVPNDGPLPLEYLEKQLNTEDFLTIEFESGTIQLDFYRANRDSKGTIQVHGVISGENYKTYNTNYDKNEEDLGLWVEAMSYILYSIYPEEDINFTVAFEEIVNEDPSGYFSDNEIFYSEETGKWLIIHSIIESKISAEDEEYDAKTRP
ncbi:stalk domain-containing protein [Tepidibacillus decaturensis]|uniref:Copper amine oxidase-like N-terminal domain-containing protein n=1 Tax=Tepidibacillus decaturensis TaxID=1413211 RepID=A0A135L6C0_9BACI|nr:stalk domain-containing protein [Tepidibacillus decaturensis]KXG44522.1 hypothetical protein U473_11215 [Tepidibacillus decaturensis]